MTICPICRRGRPDIPSPSGTYGSHLCQCRSGGRKNVFTETITRDVMNPVARPEYARLEAKLDRIIELLEDVKSGHRNP